jgi:hypothetical protein
MYTKIAAMAASLVLCSAIVACTQFAGDSGSTTSPYAASGGFAAEAISRSQNSGYRRSATGTIVADHPILTKDPLVMFGEKILDR